MIEHLVLLSLFGIIQSREMNTEGQFDNKKSFIIFRLFFLISSLEVVCRQLPHAIVSAFVMVVKGNRCC